MSHYSKQFNEVERQHEIHQKRRLQGIIEKASRDEIKLLYKVATNLKGYMNFEIFVKNVVGK